MSFNVHNTIAPPFLILCVVAIALVPVETTEARVAFWIGFGVTFGVFWLLYAPAASGEPGTAMCCGTLLLGGPAVWGIASATGRELLGPVGVALAPWVALLSGQVVFLVFVFGQAAREALRAKEAEQKLEDAENAMDLVPFLVHEQKDVRSLALERLLERKPPSAERCATLGACLRRMADEDCVSWHRPTAERIVDAVFSLGPVDREDVLELYASVDGLHHETAFVLIERELLARDWSGAHREVLAAARRRLENVGSRIDGVVLQFLGEDRDSVRELARDALMAFRLEGKTALAFGPEEGHALLSEALDAAKGSVPGSFVDAALALPPHLGFPLLARILEQGNDMHRHVDSLLEDVPRLFAGASEAPQAAQQLLEAVVGRAEGSGEAWDRIAAALRRELER